MRNNIRIRYITETNIIDMSIKCGGVNDMFHYQVPIVGTEFGRRPRLVREQAMRDIARNKAIEWTSHEGAFPLDWIFQVGQEPFIPNFTSHNTNIEV